MIALVEFDSLVAGSMRAAVDAEVAEYAGLDDLRRALDSDQSLDTVLLGPSVDQEAALEVAATYRVKRPEVGVVLVRRRLDTVLLTEAIRAGVREVLADRDLTQLTGAVQRSRQVTRALLNTHSEGAGDAEQRAHVITVFSAKGGCGKTTVATNLAAYLARGGKSTVALVDLDLAFGDVAITMQISPKHSIADALVMGDSVDSTGLMQLMAQHSSGVQVLAAPPDPELAEKFDEGFVSHVLRLLADHYDYVVIDTPPAMDGPVLAAFDASDVVALLTTLDIPSLKNTKLTLETLRKVGYSESKLRLVLNRADAKVGLDPADVDNTLGIEVTGTLPSTRDVPASTNRGEVLAVTNPKHPFSTALAAFADTQMADPDEVVETQTPKRRHLLRRKS